MKYILFIFAITLCGCVEGDAIDACNRACNKNNHRMIHYSRERGCVCDGGEIVFETPVRPAHS